MKNSLLFATGIDIESINRFEQLPFKENQEFYGKIFTKHEIAYCLQKSHPSQHFAVRFCAKEAAVKALSNLNIMIDLKKIEVHNLNNKVPKIIINDVEVLKNNPQLDVQISMSHSEDNAVASVLVILNK